MLELPLAQRIQVSGVFAVQTAVDGVLASEVATPTGLMEVGYGDAACAEAKVAADKNTVSNSLEKRGVVVFISVYFLKLLCITGFPL